MLEVSVIYKSYKRTHFFGSQRKQIIHDVYFDCPSNTTLGIIGESGSGKSTLARMILGIEKPDKGSITLDGTPIHRRNARENKISAVFQDYISSLHPFHTVQKLLYEVLTFSGEVSRGSIKETSIQLLQEVGLSEIYLDKYTHMLSGGEAQRVAIARAIALNPQYIVLDEAISSLDMSIQTQILDLLIRLRETRALSFIFITHDIQVATYICDDLIIFKNGTIEAQMTPHELYRTENTYTRALLDKQLSL
ncbi:ABC transporter ATP-binding protein [Staphylococcus caeli]|uniref:ABC transporter ATP-binding protein n=1 Tax=Staphylococcus caeli TaxID=2201815 RepID=UPI003F572420